MGMLSDVDLTANDRRVIDLVRLALAKESVKKVIKREELSEYIDNFTDKELRKKAFELANEHLKTHFGMEIVPLPNTQTNFTVTSGARSKVQKLGTTASNTSQPPNTYVVVSAFKPEEREISPQNTKDPYKLALLNIVLTLVRLNANRIEHMTLHNQLLDCNIISSSPDSPVSPAEFEAFLDEWKEQKYLAKAKRLDDQITEYCWGPRAYIEFPVDRVADLISNMAASSQEEEFDERRLKENITKAMSRQ